MPSRCRLLRCSGRLTLLGPGACVPCANDGTAVRSTTACGRLNLAEAIVQAMAASRRWTNRSVRLLAESLDPVETITERARALTLEMIEAGWPGPPFDPLWVADRLGVEVVPVDEVPDARTVPSDTGKFGVRIEYNPTRPQGRRRFSLAHEISHLLFPDVANAVRNRGKIDRAQTDDWQLELLCNLAASELVMPVGSLEELPETEPSMNLMVQLRRRLEVSFEALFLRVARLTEFPIAVFASARINPQDPDSFRVDYTVPSRGWAGGLPTAGPVDPAGLVECTAVGYTSGPSVVKWTGLDAPSRMECIGAPPFPGHRWPRVLGILFGAAKSGPRPALRILFGDATNPMGRSPQIIAHIVNDRARAWHGGFASALRRRYPQAQAEFISYATKHRLRLGGTVHADVAEDLSVATMIAQAGYGPSTRPRIRYQALRECLATVAEEALKRKATVHMPRIGTGQAGGKWSVIGGLIDEELVARGVPVTVYDLPDAIERQVVQEEFPL